MLYHYQKKKKNYEITQISQMEAWRGEKGI